MYEDPFEKMASSQFEIKTIVIIEFYEDGYRLHNQDKTC